VADAGVDAPVVDTGVDERGGMAVPHDIRTVGWYRFGAGPGAAAGSAVLAGHVDDKIQGRGAFYRLANLPAGSPVEVTLADGTVVTYRVSAVERVPKTVLPADRLFARDGPPQLALITCGGAFDRAKGGYTDNVVVTAAPEQVRGDPQAREPWSSASAPTAR
jgi:sortase (surface protein transpeptidase)